MIRYGSDDKFGPYISCRRALFAAVVAAIPPLAIKELADNAVDAAEEATSAPDDLEAKIKTQLQQNRHITWHRALRLIVDPDAPDDDDEEDDREAEDNEDLNDVDQ